MTLPSGRSADRGHACLRRGSGPVAAIAVRVLHPRAAPGDRGHACLRRGSGPVARPSTTVLLPTVRAISTTGRRMTTRPCNLSRAEPSPRRCAARCRLRGADWKTARVQPHLRFREWPAACRRVCYENPIRALRSGRSGDRAHACLRRGSGPVAAIAVRVLLPRVVPGDHGHACLRRGSGPVARPSTTVLLPTVRAISTTGRQ